MSLSSWRKIIPISDVIGSSSAPYINSLAQQGALFTSSFAVSHPSEPNYLAIFSGSMQGISDDSCPHTFSGPDLGGELIAAGDTFTGYSENLSGAGFTGCNDNQYLYARKHNPWVNFTDVPSSDNLPWTSFPTDYNTLPTISFVVPNLQDDMHDGTIQQGDTWLQQNMDSYAQWAKANNSLLVVTWDEDDLSQNNQIATIFVGQMVKSGQYNETINHYNVLRTLEDMYGLPDANSSSTATPITDAWQGVTPTPTPTGTVTATPTPTGTTTPTPTPTVTVTPTPVPSGVSSSPATPIAGQPATITYNGSLAASATSITMHWGNNGWSGVTDVVMAKQGDGSWMATIMLPQSATQLNMAFHNQSNNWDNNNGSNYNLNVSGGSSGPCSSGPVSSSPCPVHGQQATITYTGSLAASASSITLHWGYNSWNSVTETAMTKQGDGSWQATITLPQSATQLNMVFHDQSNNWDNNNSSNYNLTVS